MDVLILTIVSIVAGVIGTLFVSKYYFHRTTAKSLTPYLQFYISLFKEVDEEVRKELKIEYQGIPVTELFEIQYIIANTGEKSIRDLIEPLSLEIPNDCIVLDASVLYIHPEGRKVDAVVIKTSDGREKINFIFKLLNRDDYFVIKILIKGNPETKDFHFKITADDLPPELNIKGSPFEIISTNEKREFELEFLIAGLIIFIFGSSIAHLFYNAWYSSPRYIPDGFLSIFPIISLSTIPIYLTALLSFILVVFGAILIIGSLTDFRFSKRKKFLIPENLNKFRQDYMIERDDT